MPRPDQAPPGRDEPIPVAARHRVLDAPLRPPFPEQCEELVVGMGCFWGVEQLFWKLPGVYTTAAGYAGGYTPNPTYQEVCSGTTGHTEVVRVVYDPQAIATETLMRHFWEGHDPTQGMRQGNDMGTQYRSALFTYSDEQQALAEQTREAYQARLDAAGLGRISTELARDVAFYYAEDYHQQYLAKNPGGYCGLRGTGVRLG